MSKLILSLAFIFGAVHFILAQTPTLGTYPVGTIVIAGGNVAITPSVAPTNAASVTAYTSASFKGLLHVNPATGVVTITNAHPAGSYVVTVKVFNGATSQTASFELTVNNANCSQGLFAGTTNINTSASNVKRVVVGDFNNDGKQDFAAINAGNGRITISLGNGTGGFTPASPVLIGPTPQSITVGDFNGDGKQDLAVAMFGNANIVILSGNGAGMFSPTNFVAAGQSPISIIASDFNGDGRQDLATANNFSNNVYVRLGNGDGTFSGTTEVAVGSNPYEVVAGDFNSDGTVDLATANYNDSTVSVRFGNGAGDFSGTTTIPINGTPVAIALGDFNGDGNTDFTTANTSSNKVSVRLGDGAGGFGGATALSAGLGLSSVVTGDFNGDGRQDIAATNTESNTISVWLNNGAGVFNPVSNVVLSFSPQMTVVGDFNADGRADFAIAGGSEDIVAIRLGNLNEIDVSGNNISIADGDTTPDFPDNTAFGTASSNLKRNYTIRNTGNVALLVANIRTGGIDSALFIVSGIRLPLTIPAGGSATFSITFRPATVGTRTATVNISNDDCDEVVYDFAISGIAPASPVLGTYPTTTISNAGGNTIAIPSAAPSFAAPLSAFTSANFKGLLLVDTLTGVVTITNAHPAGTYSITVGTFASSTSFTLIVNNTSCSQGAFSGTNTFNVGTAPRAIALGDFNEDGNQDLAIPNSTSNNVSIKLGDGIGGFIGTTNLAVSRPFAITVADFNGDGNQDLAMAIFDSARVSICFGNGAGNFTGPSSFNVAAFPISIVSADFNSDGKPDLAVSNGSTIGMVSILLNNGLGEFYGLTTIPVGATPIFMVAGDFNGDLKPDLATANNSTNTVSILLGDGFGGFSAASTVIAGTNPVSIAIADFNGDNKQDLAISNQASANVSIRFGDGAGGFTGTTNIPISLSGGTLPLALATGDFNGDGNQDFLLTINGSNMIAVRLGNGTGGFSAATNVIVESNPRSLVIGDFNSDGKHDFAAANAGSNTVSIRLGAVNEINVQGNNISLADNDSTPNANDFTDFSSTPTGAVRTRTFIIQNTGAASLTINNITISGIDSSLFTVSGITLPLSIAAGVSRTFTINFSPTTPGVKVATINISNNDCDEAMFDFAITGVSCPSSDPANVWLGNTVDWNLASNWSLGFVPDQCTKVVVNLGVPFMPEIFSPNSSCYSLTLNNGATLTVTTGGHLNITANN